jgi:hypothetical protein
MRLRCPDVLDAYLELCSLEIYVNAATKFVKIASNFCDLYYKYYRGFARF